MTLWDAAADKFHTFLANDWSQKGQSGIKDDTRFVFRARTQLTPKRVRSARARI